MSAALASTVRMSRIRLERGKPRLYPAGELGHCAAGWSCESRSTCVSALGKAELRRKKRPVPPSFWQEWKTSGQYEARNPLFASVDTFHPSAFCLLTLWNPGLPIVGAMRLRREAPEV